MANHVGIQHPDGRMAGIRLPEGDIELPIIVGSENERAIDVSELRSKSGYITLDSGYGNTGSCQSSITFIDGEKGILRYRGYPIEELAEKSKFTEVAWLLISGELPTKPQMEAFSELLTSNASLHEGLRHHFEGFPPDAHPMAMLSAMINACSCYHPELLEMEDEVHVFEGAAKLLSKVRTIAAFSYRKSMGRPNIHPHPKFSYCRNFLHMMFSQPYELYEADAEVNNALRKVLILHADHEQNCSTSTVRIVGSSGANLFASTAAGVCALWGSLHGGANLAVVRMLQRIQDTGIKLEDFIEKVKTDPNERLMGFGHRVYKNFDPRVKILKDEADRLLEKLGIENKLLDLAKQLEEVALNDDYFIERKLYPNVDFYSGIILSAIKIPLNMFTVIFAIGRMPGWIANWYEQFCQGSRIARPRQIYTGPAERHYVPLDQR